MKRRARYFRQHPLCVHCEREGRVTLARELDHIVALSNGGPDTLDNVQGLCVRCHLLKTQHDKGNTRALTRARVIGCDGYPRAHEPGAHATRCCC